MHRPVAAFDVDGTIFRSSLFIELVERLIQEGHLPQSMRERYGDAKEKWVNREGSYDAYVRAMVAASYEYFRGIPGDIFTKASEAVVSSQAKHVYRYTRDLVKRLKADGHFLLAVSHSPKAILDFFCPSLGFDKWYGLIYETDSAGLLTGKVVDEHVILDKAAVVKRAVENQSLTYEGSVGVGDSETDIPLLSSVETPICFNPSSGLYAYAKKEGWKVVVERKDVVYEL
jgi:HAD superfamily hydrolase (TIGR01490 family)